MEENGAGAGAGRAGAGAGRASAGAGRASLGRDASLTPVKGQREERGLRPHSEKVSARLTGSS